MAEVDPSVLPGHARMRPLVSFVIPAYQAEETLGRALESIRRQGWDHWEAIVVDDGSTDGTGEVARRTAAMDPRIRVVRQDNRGASAARNRGVAETRGDWVGFLDSDDWLAVSFVEKLLALATDDAVGVVYCDFAVVDAKGRVLQRHRIGDMSDPFGELARQCTLAVHNALTRREVLLLAGPFDETLKLNEDWDLWQRIARTGTRFSGHGEVLAFYYNRPGSLSRHLEALFTDGMDVIDRTFRADPHVPCRDPRYAEGLPLEEKPFARLNWLLMCAAATIAAGEDPLPLLDRTDVVPGTLLPRAVDTILGGLAFGLSTSEDGLSAHWDTIGDRVGHFLAALGERTRQPRLVDTVHLELLVRVLGGRRAFEKTRLPTVHAELVDVERPLPEIDAGGKDTVALLVTRGREEFGLAYLPGGATISADLVAAAIREAVRRWPNRAEALRRSGIGRSPKYWVRVAREMANARGWGLKARALEPRAIAKAVPYRARHALLTSFASTLGGTEPDGSDGSESFLAALATSTSAISTGGSSSGTADNPERMKGGARFNSPEFWDNVFEKEDPWSYCSPYEQTKYEQTLLLVPDGCTDAIELACAEGHFTIQLAPKVGSLLATDISDKALTRAADRCRDMDNVRFSQLDFFNNPLPGRYDLVVCSEVLYEAGTLARLRRIARNISDHLVEGGVLVMAHAVEVSEERDRSGFDWAGVFGAKTIAEVFSTTPGLVLERQIETELYRIHRFRKGAGLVASAETIHMSIGAPPEAEYVAHVAWGGVEVTRREVSKERAVCVPVLMYHRIAEVGEGPGALSQYRLSPAKFEAQLNWLRRNGYHSITPDELAEFLSTGRPLAGRPVLLSFDDGYRDFATTAWPLLKHYGLRATVAVVTDLVGGSAEWDNGYGTPAPLMDWELIRQVAREGAVIASHSASHRSSTSLSAAELLREAGESRMAIEQATGRPPTTVVYPFGHADPVAASCYRRLGYRLGLGTATGTATILSDPMGVPRIPVDGNEDLAAFVTNITAVDLESGRRVSALR